MATKLITHDARSGNVYRQYSVSTESEIDKFVEKARKAVKDWSQVSIQSKQKILRRVSDGLLSERERIIEAEVYEAGKFRDDAISDLNASSELWRMAADKLDGQGAEGPACLSEIVDGHERHDPVGVVAMITPSNYPLIVLSERLPFALAAGCAVVAKPSEFTPTSTLIVQQICHQSGVPSEIFSVVIGDGMQSGVKLISNKSISMVSFTGSTKTARSIMSMIDPINVKTSFELGGKNSAVIFEDADIERACESVAYASTINGGRACIAISRVVAHSSIVVEVEALLRRKLIERLAVNRKLNGADLPQPISRGHEKTLSLWASKALELGAREITIGQSKNGYVIPRIFLNLSPLEPLFSEELFAPYLTLNSFNDYEEAIAIANAGHYGLAGYCWTKSDTTSERFSRDIHAGRIWINSDMRRMEIKLSIGGFRDSGSGRELGADAIKRYTASKSIIG
jgi:acyl-CoA reductase-like NAD-dependent aldehyde dehydrogenase